MSTRNRDKTENKVVTQVDVAREAGVTRSMVSYVISGNNERSVAPETRKRILDAIEKLGYRPNKAAQALQLGDVELAHRQIGLVLSNDEVFLRPYYTEIIAGIHTSAHEKNQHIRFIRFFDELKDPVLFNELIHREEIGGLILLACDQSLKKEEDYQLIEKIKQRIDNIVCVEWKYDGLSSVLFDRSDAAYKACEYLIKHKFNNIAYIGQNDDRVKGIRESFMEHGKDPMKLYVGLAVDLEGGFLAAKELYKSSFKFPPALICGSDEVAMGVLCFLHENKVSVPDQVSVISIDNIEMAGYMNPPLTTVNVQKNAMGSTAVDMIVSRRGMQGEKAINISLPTEIVERDSVINSLYD